MIDLCAYESMIAVITLIILQPSIYLKEDVLPGDSFLPEKHDKFIYIPSLIRDMLSYDSAMSINKYLGF